jgi:dynein intermediate chain 1
MYNVQEEEESSSPVAEATVEHGENPVEEADAEKTKSQDPLDKSADAVENEDDKKRGPLRNQFNFSERAAQTVNNPYRVRLD